MGAMKDSGIEWIGEIPVEWDVKRLKYCLRTALQYGANESGCDYREDYPRYIRITDIGINNVLKDDGIISLEPMIAKPYLLQEGDVLFARSGATVGKTFFYKNDLGLAAFAGYLIRAQVNERVLARYLFYITLGNYYDAWKNMVFSQATIQNIGADKYSQLPVVLPNLQEQRLIVKFLDKRCAQIDDVIADIKKQIELLQQYKKSLITETVTKGLDKTVPMKDSGVEWIGEIPKNWEIKRIKYIADFINGDRSENYPSGDEMVDEGVIFVTSNNIHELILSTDIGNSKYITEEKYKSLRGAKLKVDDIVFCLRGSVGMCAINKTEADGTVASSLVVIRANDLDADYLNYYLQSEYALFQTNLYTNGSCAANLSAENVAIYYVLKPPTNEQIDIIMFLNKKCTQIDSILESKQKQLDAIMEHKKSLIYEYVTGKKRVKEVQ